jgi:muramidase (phage lysozyme)
MEASGKTTTQFTDAQLATAGASKNLQSLGFSLATFAIPAVDKFAGALEKITGFINKNFGVGGTASTPRGVNRGRPGGPRASAGGAPQTLLDIIGQGESRGNYNALVGGGEADLTNMTVAQVQQLQKKMLKDGRASSAVGKYQMISSTLSEQMKKAGLDPETTKFDQKTQDQLAQQLINQAGYGKKDSATVMRNLAGTWAALPQDMSGRGRYDGYNTNKANVDPAQLMAAITGPSNNYQSQVAGVNSPSAGVETKNQATKTADEQQSNNQNMALTRQLAELNQTQRDLLAVNKKILQRQS